MNQKVWGGMSPATALVSSGSPATALNAGAEETLTGHISGKPVQGEAAGQQISGLRMTQS